MVHGLHLRNFANHRNTRLCFPRLAALVGENGAGKTKTMLAIQQVGQLVKQQQPKGELLVEATPYKIPQEFLRVGTKEMSIGVSGPGGGDDLPGQWGLRAEASAPAAHVKLPMSVTSKWLWNRTSADCNNISWVLDTKGKTIP